MKDISKVKQLITELPEIYQTIYGYTDLIKNTSRNCYDRINYIYSIYNQLSVKLNRSLKVLDLGCAQGFFCFSLAEHGAIVKGIDFLEQNISLCYAIASENPKLNVSFELACIEKTIDNLRHDQYDLIIGLSVFHHIIHLYGIERGQNLISRLANCAEVVILEIALRDEPLYWGPSQPEDPRELLYKCAFYHEITRFNTHLSDVYRPMYVISNYWLILNEYCDLIKHWRDWPYAESKDAHHGSRRYYFGQNFFCKVINFNIIGGSLLEAENQRNYEELKKTSAFLATPPLGFITPKLLGQGISNCEGWLITEKITGELLRDRLLYNDTINKTQVLYSLLEQLTILEKSGLYHDDLRTWNVLISDQDKVYLIDYGSIGNKKIDCVWPYDLFQSWMIFVNELFNPPKIKIDLLRPFALSPFNIPEPFYRWLFAAWCLPAQHLTFAKLLELFKQREQLPDCYEQNKGVERWIATIESGMQQLQLYLHHNSFDKQRSYMEDIRQQYKDLFSTIANLHQRTKMLEQKLINQYKTNQLRDLKWYLKIKHKFVFYKHQLFSYYKNKILFQQIFYKLLHAGYIKLHQYPIIKMLIINLLHKFGYYYKAQQFHRHLISLPCTSIKKKQQIIKNSQQTRLKMQLNNLKIVPYVVRNIYELLKNKR